MTEFKFGKGIADFGRIVLQELVKTDYGPGGQFDSIKGHPVQDHHGGPHSQVNLFKEGVGGSGLSVRFFEK